MKAYTKFFVMFLLLSGCAGYKELEPQPPLSNVERGYVELKVKNENFKLEQNKKYFMKFPGLHIAYSGALATDRLPVFGCIGRFAAKTRNKNGSISSRFFTR